MHALLTLAGPTASGKTAAAIALAQALDGEVVCADSVQVYRGFDIGSAKPSVEERRGVPHHLLDVLDAHQTLDAVRWARMADDAIASVMARGRLPIVAGGTPLWLRALLRGLVEAPAADAELRARLEAEAGRNGLAALHERLRQLDPPSAARIHPHDRVRIVRALEITLRTGRPASVLRAAHALGARRHPGLLVVLEPERDAHERAIEVRVDAMLRAGLLEETRALLARHGASVRPLRAVGYAEMVMHLNDGLPLEQARARMLRRTRRYARQQRLWWRNEPGVDLRTTLEALLSPEGLDRVRAALGR
ncbi:MAG: tRNA (adenosine(37)-N6)-dimethylallyltransferase MiaA [Myxococcota bacterium]|nr:tRNA (adenosine(37)-N6)-dimethylallyltransferase MiaA [Myxococcota bacterium]MDW8362697.1 tRNA (adenosine(37)-N6)-dimethylallyltransferase MiaA [Myxococcales bacterium]